MPSSFRPSVHHSFVYISHGLICHRSATDETTVPSSSFPYTANWTTNRHVKWAYVVIREESDPEKRRATTEWRGLRSSGELGTSATQIVISFVSLVNGRSKLIDTDAVFGRGWTISVDVIHQTLYLGGTALAECALPLPNARRTDPDQPVLAAVRLLNKTGEEIRQAEEGWEVDSREEAKKDASALDVPPASSGSRRMAKDREASATFRIRNQIQPCVVGSQKWTAWSILSFIR
ncbi:hypothetical protein BDZ97DRAFT_1927546 [Flammula alnicola]|nr:hypothetical protein BDZ97DRAFT_1927546 [Flammula alnicola]